jgi:hypothetical protein
MIDGKIDAGEWSDAAVKDLPDGVRLYVKRSNEYLWFAVEVPNAGDAAVDLYVCPAVNEIYDLHASARLGERRSDHGKWPQWQWWNNRLWVANTSRVSSFENRTFLATSVREYQIRLDKFPGPSWKVMFELLTPAEPEWKTTPYPAGAANLNPNGWWTLDLTKGE